MSEGLKDADGGLHEVIKDILARVAEIFLIELAALHFRKNAYKNQFDWALQDVEMDNQRNYAIVDLAQLVEELLQSPDRTSKTSDTMVLLCKSINMLHTSVLSSLNEFIKGGQVEKSRAVLNWLEAMVWDLNPELIQSEAGAEGPALKPTIGKLIDLLESPGGLRDELKGMMLESKPVSAAAVMKIGHPLTRVCWCIITAVEDLRSYDSPTL